MGYQMEGPLGRYTDCSRFSRRGPTEGYQPAPILDVVLIGLTALGARLGEHHHGHERRARKRG